MPDTRLYETSIETTIMDHFMQTLRVRVPIRPCPSGPTTPLVPLELLHYTAMVVPKLCRGTTERLSGFWMPLRRIQFRPRCTSRVRPPSTAVDLS